MLKLAMVSVGLLLVDFEQFFDTLRQERLFHKMQTVGIPAHIIMLWKELAQTHSVKVVSNNVRGEPVKVLVGVPQGSGWSPELAALYVDVGLARDLQNLHTGIVELPGGVRVHLLMFADDLLAANLHNTGLQAQFDIIEGTSEQDGLRISYPKTELTVFRSGHRGQATKWTIHGNRGVISESDCGWTKYLGFYVEADGYQKQWEANAERVEAAGGALIPLFSNHPQMTNEMRTTVYSAKVRSLALLGADIWGWRRAYRIEKSDAKSLRILARAHSRTKLEALLWITGLYPIWVLAAIQAFGFLISILEHGDVMELAAWEHWKTICRQQRRGWAFDMLAFFDRIGLLDRMGGREHVLEWTALQAKSWLTTFRERCENLAEQEMLQTLQAGKYSFLVHAIPTFKSPRPHSLSLGTLPGRALNKFLLSAHLLEVETGRYARQQREHRYCQACKRSLGLSILGDEQHSLSVCARASHQRQQSYLSYTCILSDD